MLFQELMGVLLGAEWSRVAKRQNKKLAVIRKYSKMLPGFYVKEDFFQSRFSV